MEVVSRLFLLLVVVVATASGAADDWMACGTVDRVPNVFCSTTKARRYDIANLGVAELFQGWADVQGHGLATDYCRIVAGPPVRLSCALGGTHGCSDTNYNSVEKEDFPVGQKDTWFMRDEDNDGRDDYCRCLYVDEAKQKTKVVCTRAGPHGFLGPSDRFTRVGSDDCEKRPVRPEVGREYVIP